MKKVLVALFAVAIYVGFFAPQVNANLIIDVRAASSTGNTVVSDSKTVSVGGVGDVVHFEIYAVTTGSDGDITNDGVQMVCGNIVQTRDSTLWSVRGNMSNSFLHPLFFYPFARLGKIQDINDDGDVDIGKKAGGLTFDYWIAHSGVPSMNTTSTSQFLGSFDWTVTEVHGGVTNPVSTTINFDPNISDIVNDSAYRIDGVVYTHLNRTTPPSGAGAPINISYVPEPSTVVLLGMACLAMFAVHRRKK